MAQKVTIVGGGLAGSEAAWQVAQRGVGVRLFEMRPVSPTPVHHTGLLAELVCSNSLGSALPDSPAGLLKEEMRRLGSLIIQAADKAAIPAGSALAVDREVFAKRITEALESHPLVELIRKEVTDIPEGIAIVATGPLTSPPLAEAIEKLTGAHDLYFYDAASPILTAESLDASAGFWASRYGKGGADYFNCVLTEEEYGAFWEALINAERHEPHLGDELRFFEGCMPVEDLAARGKDTLRFGPMRPVGLIDPRTGRQPFAVVQLRKENLGGTLLEMVGFQTRLKWNEQKRVFSLIPALRHAEFVRYGVIHRNTFLNAPRVLLPTFQFRGRPDLFFAGQITGVEGYVESSASGLIAGMNAARLALGEELITLPPDTMIGALANYISHADPHHFQPMNANFGLLPPPEKRVRGKKERRLAQGKRALESLVDWQTRCGIAGVRTED